MILLNLHDAFGVHVWRAVGSGQYWIAMGWGMYRMPASGGPWSLG
jgi:hypothetical protein